MNCEETRAYIKKYQVWELDVVIRVEVLEHLNNCHLCYEKISQDAVPAVEKIMRKDPLTLEALNRSLPKVERVREENQRYLNYESN